MTHPNEIGHDGSVCGECGKDLPLQVLYTNAGFYLGTRCNCGPYSRESHYFETREAAEKAMADDPEGITWRRT